MDCVDAQINMLYMDSLVLRFCVKIILHLSTEGTNSYISMCIMWMNLMSSSAHWCLCHGSAFFGKLCVRTRFKASL